MKSYAKITATALIFIFLILFSFLFQPVSAKERDPDVAENMDMVYSREELMDWFAKHPGGGEVSLGSNIDTGRYLSLETNSPVTIHMNGYGILVQSQTNISGPVRFYSSDNPEPVFNVAPATNISFSKDVRIDLVNSCGLYFQSGVNIDLPDSSSSSFNGSFFNMSVSGSEGIGIKCNGDLSLGYFNIRLEKGACGIEVEGKTSLFLTGITGNGNPLRTSGEVTLDCCGISSVPANAAVINRTILSKDSFVNYIVSPGTSEELLNRLPGLTQFTFQSDDPSVPKRTALLPITWNIENVDAGTPGIYEFSTYLETLPILGLDIDFPQINGTVLVSEPGKFYLYSASSSNKNVRLHFYESPAYDSYIELFYSTDAGATWQPFEDFSFIYPGELYLETPLDKTFQYLFQADITTNGITTRTNILKVKYGTDGFITPQITDGDRDGSDRDDQPILPPDNEIKPPNETSPPGDMLPAPSPGDNSNSSEESETSAPGIETEPASTELPDINLPSTKPSSTKPHSTKPSSTKPPSANRPSYQGSDNDTPETADISFDNSSGISSGSQKSNVSENHNQSDRTEHASTYSDSANDDTGKHTQNSATQETDKSKVKKTPETEAPTSDNTADKEKKGSFMPETSPVLKANPNNSMDSLQSNISNPMPVSKSGQVLPKLLLLCSAVILACLTLYWRGKRK